MKLEILLWLIISAVSVNAAGVPPARLYVKTEPPGASVTIDGVEAGKSDNLFELSPGLRHVSVALNGYRVEQRDVELRASRITRLEIKLVAASPSTRPVEPANTQAADAATAYLGRSGPSDRIRDAMLTVIRQHPNETRWSGRDVTHLFGIAAKRLPLEPMRDRARPAIQEMTISLAIHELLTAKSLLDLYAEAGLSDATTLRNAVTEIADELHITGDTGGIIHQAAVQGEFAVAYAIGDSERIKAQLREPARMELIARAYRDVMHAQARDLMARGNWSDAILMWRHLHQRKLVSQSLYLDAAVCFKRVNQNQDAVRVLAEALDTFAKSGSAQFFERAGDLAIEIEGEQAQMLSEKAYRLASQKLLNTISPPPRASKAPADDLRE